MFGDNEKARTLVQKWSEMKPNTMPDFWCETSALVASLKETHSDAVRLNLVTRKLACCQCLATIKWAVSYFDDVNVQGGGPVSCLEEVVNLLALLVRPFHPALVSQLEDLGVLKRLVGVASLAGKNGGMRRAVHGVICNLIDDRADVVDAVILRAKEEIKSSSAVRKGVSAKASGRQRPRPAPVSLPVRPSPSPLLQFLSEAEVGGQIPPGLLSRVHLVEAGPDMHQVVIGDLLPDLVGLMNAPWRQENHGFLVLGVDPESRRMVGVRMNGDDRDAFRVGFDQRVIERLHPQPIAGTLRLHFAELREEASSGQRPAVLIVVEIGRVLVDEAFSYVDIYKSSKRKRYVTVTLDRKTFKM